MAEIALSCPAKINLALDVLRRREDGYHEVRMVMMQTGLCDTLTVAEEGDGITLVCSREDLPAGRDNLIYRAAELFFARTGFRPRASFRLQKRIPIGAGLAGGSTDAAGALRGLNRLFGSPLSAWDLFCLGEKLGADVPFCLLGGCALAEGIGTDLTPLPLPPKAAILLAKPMFSVSTAEVYGGLRLDGKTEHPDIDGVVQGLREGDWGRIIGASGNVLESVTGSRYPQIGEIEHIMRRFGASFAQMSGSGPSVFGVFFEEEKAKAAARELRRFTEEVFLV